MKIINCFFFREIAPELMTKVINKEQHHVHDETAYENIDKPIIQGSSNMKIMVRPFMHKVTEIEVGNPMEEVEKLLSEDPKIEKVLEQVHANIRKTLVASNMYEAMGKKHALKIYIYIRVSFKDLEATEH